MKSSRFLENFIILIIIVVIIQTFLSDLAVLLGWQVRVQNILLFIGFVVDVIFTIEFFARFIYSASIGDSRKYIIEERGWIDFLASVPLLVFNSGPELFAFLTNTGNIIALGGILQILKVIKAIRIARVLRFLRVLKIFCRIKNAESVMAQRHLAHIATLVVTTMILALIGFAVLDSILVLDDEYIVYEQLASRSVEYIMNIEGEDRSALVRSYSESIPIILLVRSSGQTIFSRYSNEEYERFWSLNDYAYISNNDYEIFFDIRYLNVSNARSNIIFFIVILCLTLVLMFLYSPHFALTVSDPIHVMRKGFDEIDYNLEVRIPENYKNDEIYRLASSYNNNYLPLKDREERAEGASVIQLSIDELTDITDIQDIYTDDALNEDEYK